MTKATAKAKVSKDTDNAGGTSWIPSGPVASSKKKQDLSISTILELKHISTKMDKFGRLSSYFVYSNPNNLNVIPISFFVSHMPDIFNTNFTFPFFFSLVCSLYNLKKPLCNCFFNTIEFSLLTL